MIDSRMVPNQADSSIQDSHYSLERPSENHDVPLYNSLTQNDTDMIPEPQRQEWEISNTMMINYQVERTPNTNGFEFAWLDGLSLGETLDSRMFRGTGLYWRDIFKHRRVAGDCSIVSGNYSAIAILDGILPQPTK